MKFLSVTYNDGSTDCFENIKNYEKYVDMLSFTYNPTTSIAKNVFTYIRMKEVRKFEVWETNVD